MNFDFHPKDFASEEHEFCVIDGELFVDNKFAAQLCWDWEKITAALGHYLDLDWLDRVEVESEYVYNGNIRNEIKHAPKFIVKKENGLLTMFKGELNLDPEFEV